MPQIIIHRGAQAIGGNCVEVRSGNHRILLDIGLPLMDNSGETLSKEAQCAPSVENGVMPDIEGLYTHQAPSFDGVILSHAHLDHFGLMKFIHPEIPIYMSGESNALIDIGNIFYPSEFKQENLSNRIDNFKHKKRFDIGPFTITPHLADHSAFGACSLLVERDGRRIFYTGDFWGYGRKGKLFDAFVKKPIQGVDCLLMEGTTIGGNHNVGYASEDEVEEAVRQIIRSQQDACFVTAAGSNIDRTVSIYRAAMAAEKTLVLDLYQYHLLKTLKNFSNRIPPHSWDNIRIYYVWYHAERIAEHLDQKVLYKYYSRKIEQDEIVNRRKNMVLRLPLSTMTMLAGKMNGERSLDGANYIYSMWSGYLKSDPAFRNFYDKYKIPMSIIHTSGHAYLEDLKRLVSALKPKATIPVHTLSGDSFGDYFPNVVRLEDKETFQIE